MSKIVLTGAAGRLGSYLREPLSQLCDTLVSTDIAEQPGTLYPGESYMQADLADFDAMGAVIEGAEMVIHMGAFVDEGPFEQLLGPNFVGSYNVWENAHRHGVRRVVYASSIHAVGMYPKNEFIGTDVPHRPDTFYGLAKCFTEDLGRMYWEKRGLESVHMRILSCAQVNNARALGSWLSYDDLIQLVTRCIDTPVTGFAIIYGVSDNDRAPVDNANAHFLGYRPKDNAEVFAEEVLANEPRMDPHDPNHMCHGGPFAGVDLGNSGLAGMNVIDDTKKT
ncbi:NAD(P)-dependent oxidoreductase [Sulfitobacter albidus]|uniref:NAD(P)-dependent oxidoreductase n=1 Tax=Sulfitobacter albidus TaxID=2829501 RepID=A0A975JHF8_9RHOB|nr:NAD(P)-dependent oxidoreductase [Sulfitobacter albidus]QUJ78015.1 NAD(P)-dependent oxidoreductase [Sulfitobacter albidus]